MSPPDSIARRPRCLRPRARRPSPRAVPDAGRPGRVSAGSRTPRQRRRPRTHRPDARAVLRAADAHAGADVPGLRRRRRRHAHSRSPGPSRRPPGASPTGTGHLPDLDPGVARRTRRTGSRSAGSSPIIPGVGRRPPDAARPDPAPRVAGSERHADRRSSRSSRRHPAQDAIVVQPWRRATDRQVALTFDLGGRPGSTRLDIVDWLTAQRGPGHDLRDRRAGHDDAAAAGRSSSSPPRDRTCSTSAT